MLGFEGQCYYKEKGENCDTKEHQRVNILRWNIKPTVLCLHLKYVPPTDKNSSDAETHDIDLNVNVLDIQTWLY
jgi:hypothetical protein